jgi:hypothetical protein
LQCLNTLSLLRHDVVGLFNNLEFFLALEAATIVSGLDDFLLISGVDQCLFGERQLNLELIPSTLSNNLFLGAAANESLGGLQVNCETLSDVGNFLDHSIEC